MAQKAILPSPERASALPSSADVSGYREGRLIVGEQQERFRVGEPARLADGFKPDIGNPVALAPAQTGLFILALEGCRRASKQRRFYILKCVDADDGIQAAVDSAGDHRHHTTGGAHVKLGSLGAERVF